MGEASGSSGLGAINHLPEGFAKVREDAYSFKFQAKIGGKTVTITRYLTPEDCEKLLNDPGAMKRLKKKEVANLQALVKANKSFKSVMKDAQSILISRDIIEIGYKSQSGVLFNRDTSIVTRKLVTPQEVQAGIKGGYRADQRPTPNTMGMQSPSQPSPQISQNAGPQAPKATEKPYQPSSKETTAQFPPPISKQKRPEKPAGGLPPTPTGQTPPKPIGEKLNFRQEFKELLENSENPPEHVGAVLLYLDNSLFELQEYIQREKGNVSPEAALKKLEEIYREKVPKSRNKSVESGADILFGKSKSLSGNLAANLLTAKLVQSVLTLPPLPAEAQATPQQTLTPPKPTTSPPLPPKPQTTPQQASTSPKPPATESASSRPKAHFKETVTAKFIPERSIGQKRTLTDKDFLEKYMGDKTDLSFTDASAAVRRFLVTKQDRQSPQTQSLMDAAALTAKQDMNTPLITAFMEQALSELDDFIRQKEGKITVDDAMKQLEKIFKKKAEDYAQNFDWKELDKPVYIKNENGEDIQIYDNELPLTSEILATTVSNLFKPSRSKPEKMPETAYPLLAHFVQQLIDDAKRIKG